MSDLQKYINKRKNRDADFANGFDEGYETFKIGLLLRQAREEAGLTQAKTAELLHTNKSTISKIEQNPKNVSLSTLEKFVASLGKRLEIKIY